MAEMTEELVKQLATDAVSAFVKESGLDKIDQKFLVIPEVDEKEQLKKSKKERFGQLVKAVVDKDYLQISTITKAAAPNNMTTDADGGYLVPDETAAEILDLIPTYGQARALVDVGIFPKNRDLFNVPVNGTGMTVYYPGEQGSITSSKLAISTIQMQAKKAAGIAVLTNELKDFAIVDFVAHINKMAARAFAQDEDSKVFGIDNTVFTGLFYKLQTYGYEKTIAPASLTYADLLDMVYNIDQNYLVGASWIMHRTVFELVRKLNDTTSRPLLLDANAGSLPLLLGYPVRLIEAAPASNVAGLSQPYLLLGNLGNSYLKDKQGMSVAVTTEATVDASSMFQTDMTALRFIRHWTFHPGQISAYSVAQTAAI